MLISDIAKLVNGTVIGDASEEVSFLCKIEAGFKGGISFLANPKYASYLMNTEATAVFVKPEFSQSSATLIQVKDPYMAFVLVAEKFYKLPEPLEKGIHKQAFIEHGASIGNNCSIGPFVYIGKNTRIDDNCLIYPNVTIMEDCLIGENARIYSNVSIREQTQIGRNVTLHNGAVIGSDGFGFAPDLPHGLKKIYQMGIVRIEDNVEIGANTCIDRATLGETVIGKGTKLDNLVQIAHNVRIGKNNVMAAQVGVAGSASLGDWNQIGGQAALNGHVIFGNMMKIGAQSGVAKAFSDGSTVMGTPAVLASEYRRMVVGQNKLADLIKDIRELKKEINDLKNKNV
jgi:UDP-3-O-[3-hydroxymyristoyl] glucosamine N-acyltransferase